MAQHKPTKKTMLSLKFLLQTLSMKLRANSVKLRVTVAS